jgi:ornithine decarboxylase
MFSKAAKMAPLYPTPFFFFDLDCIRENYERIAGAFSQSKVYYAVKANNHQQVLLTLRSVGSRFEIGSRQEAEILMDIGVPPDEMIFSAPVKLPSHIKETYERGIRLYVFDSDAELRKLAAFAPGSKILVRLSVSNQGSLFPLSLKFGTLPTQAISLLREGKALGLEPYGLAFHVGSQCERVETWREAMQQSAEVWALAEKAGISLRLLDIGGGFPIPYLHEVPSIEEIAREVLYVFNSCFPPDTELILEPGRYLVGDAAVLVSTVIGMAERGDKKWLYLDVGAFQGLLEAMQVKGEFPYEVRTESAGGKRSPYVLSGPTCDPDDTILNEVWLPEVQVGDRVYIMNTGAYSFVYATQFHGFSPPEIHFISDLEERVVSEVMKGDAGERERRGHRGSRSQENSV